jgi:hypothetical protein
MAMTDTELVRRLEKLERDNRRMKRAGIAILALIAGLVAVAATRPVPGVIQAREFDAVDRTGNIRVKMGVGSEGTALTLYDGSGHSEAGLAIPTNGQWPAVWLSDGQDKAKAQMNVAWGNPQIWLEGPQGQGQVFLGVSPSDSPTITLSDAQGFKMQLGSTQTVTERTGQTQTTSADSIVMFGKDNEHRIIWRAP